MLLCCPGLLQRLARLRRKHACKGQRDSRPRSASSQPAEGSAAPVTGAVCLAGYPATRFVHPDLLRAARHCVAAHAGQCGPLWRPCTRLQRPVRRRREQRRAWDALVAQCLQSCPGAVACWEGCKGVQACMARGGRKSWCKRCGLTWLLLCGNPMVETVMPQHADRACALRRYPAV